ncbi:hypothetical protein HBH56_104610 [Parastagonospora nodorum]|uniref:Uncharacterized protein n=1 Tax=Phaeosphaeria nodorum (strain SN15 / ATCC MYA-4574 / FGSC 10173) TaxID=321614 RepID=A0A7U2I8I3_PHANO|nr:hypothetical protein HBH56_104610 [Parastagonospora nodorum]QRD04698.1 hypothetical protein JI435_421580 [Parastagonospora nodorum SN15]KAH3929577.1 hypothetical protein HBH54_125800 [Parastagonospora nodorum]KAH3999232.1 hypothetical protein HBI10_120610 [Parastagonospora nodorum]KAH4025035.1 hypothetical protein HBI13_076580 [Parastagonospora nodorum]
MPRILVLLDVLTKERTIKMDRVTVSMHDIVITFEPHRPLVSNLVGLGRARQPEMMIRSIEYSYRHLHYKARWQIVRSPVAMPHCVVRICSADRRLSMKSVLAYFARTA